MAMVSWNSAINSERPALQVFCRKKERNRDNYHPYKVIEITPPPKSLGIRCFPSNLQCGESVTIEDQTYTISAVTHRYQLRKGPQGVGQEDWWLWRQWDRWGWWWLQWCLWVLVRMRQPWRLNLRKNEGMQ
ncbi:uncharacterized protein LOC133859899 [Alnus glutinosa]|uniref:uncharacterized protein LOC133859899 n=1 Tax=Alnus glutinosa TaxID=3517 RepID=UPI002D7A1335|nr:uncharacterized protein LOC133859899 [Alnus glutinosa]